MQQVEALFESNARLEEKALRELLAGFLELAVHIFELGQFICASIGRNAEFSSSAEDFEEAQMEDEPEFAFSQLSLSIQHVLVYHVLSQKTPEDSLGHRSLALHSLILPIHEKSASPEHGDSQSQESLSQADMSVIEVFDRADFESLLWCYRNWWLLPGHREQEAQTYFLPRFCDDLLEFTGLCLIYWHAIYQLLYDAADNPFGMLSQKIKAQLKACSPRQLVGLCLLLLRDITTFRGGTRDFYDSVEGLDQRRMYEERPRK